MKKNIVTILLMFMLMGCNKDYSTGALYKITNSSTHSIQLKVFHFLSQNNGAHIDSTYNLPSASTITDQFEGKTSKRKVDSFSIPPFFDADSAQIIFDGNMRISYKQLDANPRNILHLSSYTGGKTDKRIFEYQYYITDEDYKNAVKIK